MFLVAKEELRENAICSVNKMLDKKLLEREFLHEISKLCIEVMNKHTPEELKEAIRKRERERGQN